MPTETTDVYVLAINSMKVVVMKAIRKNSTSAPGNRSMNPTTIIHRYKEVLSGDVPSQNIVMIKHFGDDLCFHHINPNDGGKDGLRNAGS
jgi:hypothetical protein